MKIASPQIYDAGFRAVKPDNENAQDVSHILPNTPKTRVKQRFQKTSSAFLDYPVRGLKGDINSDFYEFLTLGTVPYLAGSAMFMVAFNCVNKYLDAKGKTIARDKGYKMALGVVFYGILKTLSKNLITYPVKKATGIDTELPYENVVYPLPKEAGENANIEVKYQQRKIYDSKEFFRKDLLNREYYDQIAQKLGLGNNLNDSISETTPIIQNIVATTNTAKSISSYLWAGVGVGLAVQNSWSAFFDSFSHRRKFTSPDNYSLFQKIVGHLKNFGINTFNITKTFLKSLLRSCAQMWKGQEGHKGYRKHAGKAFISLTAVTTALLTYNAINRAKSMAKNNNKTTIIPTEESTVI